MYVDEDSVLELLQAGVHFGHKATKWNPKMSQYIHAKRNMVHLIDIKATIRGIVQACHFLESLAKKGGLILIVGTKRQIKSIVDAEAKRVQMPSVIERWPGGLLTNFQTVRKGLNKLTEIERWETDGVLQSFTKKEAARILRMKRKLLRNLDGVRQMERLPDCLLVVDPVHEKIAVQEANKVGACIVALLDTDADPELVDIAVPCNDDSLKVVQIILAKLADAIVSGITSGVSKVAHVEEVAQG